MCCVSSSCTSVSLPADMCVWCYARHVMGRESGRVVRGVRATCGGGFRARRALEAF